MSTTADLDRYVPGDVLARVEREAGSWASLDATLVFVDLSGFTALSERLAAQGRVGAEELTGVLSRVFGDMLDLVANRGGALLKYGGDALLLVFEGPDHAGQAASAAAEMRSALRTASEIPTSVGRMSLRMSVGIHSGEILLFAAGGSHTELIVAGPAATMVNRMEGTADAGEIVVSSTTKALLPPSAVGRGKGDGWLLRWRKGHVDPCGVPAFHGHAPQSPERFIPTQLRNHLSAGEPEPEHRLGTVVFVEVLDVDTYIAKHGPAAMAETLADLVEEVTTIADDEGVTFLATDVDAGAFKIILVAGVPRTAVDEDGRALRAARRIADVTTPLGIKIGVNHGHVFSGEIGTHHRSTYTIMGDTVNLAARLMAAASRGEILASPGVVDASRTVFATEEIEPFHVKGKEKPVRAFRVGSEIGTRERVIDAEGPFVGRVEERERLTALFEQLTSGSGSSVQVVGPTGIGKTRLVNEVVAEFGTDPFEVRAEPYGAANPYRPFRDPVRALLGVERGPNEAMEIDLLEGIRAAAPKLLPFAPLVADIAHIEMEPTEATRSIDGRFRAQRTADVFVDLLVASASKPLVVVAEDAHWADAASRGLIDRLAEAVEDHPWLVIVTSREPDGRDRALVLSPLDRAECISFVHDMTETAPLRPDVVDAIAERSGGNPLFLTELVEIAKETGDVSSLPTSLDEVIGSQVDGLEPLPRRVLQYVSVLGRSFRTAVARDLIATQGIRLDDATRRTLEGFLEEDGPDRLQFRHALVRDIAYEGLSYRKRRELHLRAAALVRRVAGNDPESFADILRSGFLSTIRSDLLDLPNPRGQCLMFDRQQEVAEIARQTGGFDTEHVSRP